MRRYLRGVLMLCAMAAAAPTWAGGPVQIQAVDDGYNFVASGVGSPTTTTITLTFNANGIVGEAAQIASLALQGANSGDFAILPSSTCAVGTDLDTGNTSCTVVVQYTPSTTSAETAQLAVSCNPVGLVGGFSLNCTGATGTMSLFGSAAAALAATPALDSRMLTVLALLLVGSGGCIAVRRG